MNDQQHPGLPCSSCRTILPFVEYGHKEGKNGKPAKWPIYEKCKNPECKTGRKNLGIAEEEKLPEYVPLPEPRKGPPSSLHQWNPSRAYAPVYYTFFAAHKLSAEKASNTSITSILMHAEDAREVSDQFPDDTEWRNDILYLLPPEGTTKPELIIEPRNIKVTKKYRYFVVESRESVEVSKEQDSDEEPPTNN